MSASVAGYPSMLPRSPARSKPTRGGGGSTTTITTTTTTKKEHHQRQKSSHKVDMVDRVDAHVDEIRRMLQNYDDEVQLRRTALETEIAAALRRLHNALEIPDLIYSLKDITASQFVNVYKCDMNAAYKALISGTGEEVSDEINRTIKKRKRVAATAGIDTGNNTAATEDDDLFGTGTAGSPSKPRKNMRIAPPTPKMGSSLHNTTSTFPRSASRTGGLVSRTTAAGTSRVGQLQQGNNSTISSSAPTQYTSGSMRDRHAHSSNTSSHLNRASAAAANNNNTSSSNAGNFIYKARPSLTVPTNFNGPRLPQTPKAFASNGNGSVSTAARTATAAGKSTARRLPRKLESIQAYSMNGSPLGMFDLAVEQAAAASSEDHHTSAHPPSSSQGHGQSQSETEEEDWEMLGSRTAASASASATAASRAQVPHFAPLEPISSVQSQASATPLSKISPSKLGKKPSNSAFKNKILAGASKAFGGMHNHNNHHSSASASASAASTTTLHRPPTREKFTFAPVGSQALPTIPSQSNILEQWETMKADLARIVPDPEQRKLFEQRYFEVMGSASTKR